MAETVKTILYVRIAEQVAATIYINGTVEKMEAEDIDLPPGIPMFAKLSLSITGKEWRP